MIHELAIALIVKNSSASCNVDRGRTGAYCLPVSRFSLAPHWVRPGAGQLGQLPRTHPADVMVGNRCYIIG
jgi:hypothetical protein